MKFSKPQLPLRTTLLYLLFGSLWILLSDQVLSLYVSYNGPQTMYQTVKGWFFILISGFLLYILLHRDLAARKQAEQALRESEERFRLMFENNPAIMMLIEPASGAIRSANHAAAEFYGYSTAELCRMNINEINPLNAEEVQAERMPRPAREADLFQLPAPSLERGKPLCGGALSSHNVGRGNPVVLHRLRCNRTQENAAGPAGCTESDDGDCRIGHGCDRQCKFRSTDRACQPGGRADVRL